MKKNYTIKLLLIALISLAQMNSWAQQSEIEKGNQLVYDVQFNGSAFEMRMNLLALQPEIIFDWKLSVNDQTSGTIRIPEQALKRSTSLYTKFDKGPQQLMNQSCMWLSEFALDAAAKNGEVVLSVNGEYRPFQLTQTQMHLLYTSSGATTFECLVLKDTERGYEIWVLNNLENPLVVKMHTDWSLQLASIRENY